MSIETAQKAIRFAGIDKRCIGALVHGSVCRDFLEPATACVVHHSLDLPNCCAVYDVSNACLGLLNGMLQVANMIELGQIRAGIVMGTESSRALVETTIRHLNADTSLSRNDIKSAFASLTIGSGSAAIVLCDRELSRTGNRLLGGVMHAASEHCELCQGGHSERQLSTLHSPMGNGGKSSNSLPAKIGREAGGEGGANVPPLLMRTDSESLMREGVAAARQAFLEFQQQLEWSPDDVQKIFCHQVGRAHQRLLFESLGLSPQINYSTLEYLGNTGAVALPLTAAIGIENEHLQKDDRVAFLGIGSGINVIMLGIEWQKSGLRRGRGIDPQRRPDRLRHVAAAAPARPAQ